MKILKQNCFIFGVVIMVSMLIFNTCLADQLIPVETALWQIFPKAASTQAETLTLQPELIAQIERDAQLSFDESHHAQLIKHTIYSEGQVIGYAFEDIVKGKWGPIHYLVGLDTFGTVLQTVVLDYQEIRGKPVAKKRFLNQYKGRSINDPVMLKQDIDGITGATISSRSLTDGVRKILHVFRALQASSGITP